MSVLEVSDNVQHVMIINHLSSMHAPMHTGVLYLPLSLLSNRNFDKWLFLLTALYSVIFPVSIFLAISLSLDGYHPERP